MPLYIVRMFRSTLLCFIAAAECAQALAQTPILDEVHTVATAQTGVPVEHDFQIFSAGTYTATLTDLGAQATAPATATPLASLKMVLTANDALVGSPLIVEAPGTSNTTGVATLTFTAPASATYPVTYRTHVIGAPASGQPAGPISLQIAAQGSSSALDSWNDVIALPPQALPGTEAVLRDTYMVSTSGSYQVALTDLQLPHALGTLTMILIQSGTNNFFILPNAQTQTVQLAAGTYQIYAIGQVASSATGGLFSVTITAPAGVTNNYARTEAVGTTAQLGNTAELSAGSYTAATTDLRFPAPLVQVGVVLVSNGQPTSLSVGGTATTALAAGQSGTFTSGGGSYQVFAAATPTTAAPGTGAFATTITAQGGMIVFSEAQGATTPGGTVVPFAVDVNITTAGTYTAGLTDFQIPANLTVADLAVVQAGALVGTPNMAVGNLSAGLAAGNTTLIAFAQGGQGGSSFDISLANSSAATVLDQPEAVGVTFASSQLSITSAATYDFTLTDLDWPAPFATLAGIVTQGGTVLGEIFGGGSLNAIQVNPGKYYVNILATPASGANAPDQAGTYVINVVAAPAPPTVTLSASPTAVASGGTVTLSWTTTGATSCTASGGTWTGTYTGAQASSGGVTSPTISAATTFTLTCSGAGGSGSGSTTVTIAAAKSGGGGGGGGLSLDMLLLLAGLALHRMLDRIREL
jgi:hypothetical protein